jgi:hypothetical protein
LLVGIKIASIIMAFTMSTTFGQSATDDASMAVAANKGRFIFSMAKYVDWPKQYKSGDFIIGIYGDENIYKYVSSKYSGKLVGSQTAKIVRYINISEIDECHLLYVSSSKSSYIEKITNKIDQKKTIIVTNKSGLINQGPTINFVPVKGQLKWEINLTKAKKNKFIIGEMLKKYAYNII